MSIIILDRDMPQIKREDLTDVGVDVQLLALRAEAARQGLSLSEFLNKVEKTAAQVVGTAKAARGAAYTRSLPIVSAAFTGKEAYDLVTNPRTISDFRASHEEMKKDGYGSIMPRTISVLANPLTTIKAVGEDIGDGLTETYLRNFRPDLLPENYDKTAVPSSAARVAKEQALMDVYSKAEQEADQLTPLEEAYNDVVSYATKPVKFKTQKPELRQY